MGGRVVVRSHYVYYIFYSSVGTGIVHAHRRRREGRLNEEGGGNDRFINSWHECRCAAFLEGTRLWDLADLHIIWDRLQ